MAKISSYTTVTPVGTDLLIGTDVGGTPADATKNFTADSIAALAGAGGHVTLQQVLDANNTATQSITLTGNITLTGDITAVNSTITGTLSANGGVGTAGQVLSSQGLGSPAQWVDHSTLGPNLFEVLQVGNTALNSTIELSGTGNIIVGAGASSFAGLTTFSQGVTFSSTINAGGGVGAAGEILSSTGTGVQWIAATTTPTLLEVLNAGDTALNGEITLSGTGKIVVGTGLSSFGGNVTFTSTIRDGAASTGLAGEVLSSTGTGVAWVAAGGGGSSLTHVVKTAAYTAVNGDMVGCRILASPFTISPPTTPAAGERFGVQDISNNAAAHSITIDFNTQGTKWNAQASDLVMSKNSFCVIFEYISATYGWALVGGAIP